MNELLNKISSYNVFNFLLPGVLFAFFAQQILLYPLLQRDIVVGAFLYYFLGMVVSRFGSLVLEPILKAVHFVRNAEYGDFIAAEKRDEKLTLLSEVNNTYRTLCSLFVLLLLLKAYTKAEDTFPVLRGWKITIIATLLAIMFLFSYRKQVSFIKRRIKSAAG
jgi:hypothetical protein